MPIPSKEFKNSKEKGNIGEAIILSEFVKRKIPVSIPFGDNQRYDIIAEFNGKLNKIQVKYTDQKEVNNSITIPTSSSYNHTTNKQRKKYINDVDYIACYINKWNECCLIPIDKIGNKTAIKIRKERTKNAKHCWTIAEFSFDKILCVETLHDEPKQ